MKRCHVGWHADEHQAEIVSFCTGAWSAEEDGKLLFYSTPKTGAAYAKALIASRLPRSIEQAEVVAFLPTAELQFQDIMFHASLHAPSLSLLCSESAAQVGDLQSVEAWAKAELHKNLNPIQQFRGHWALALAWWQQQQQ